MPERRCLVPATITNTSYNVALKPLAPLLEDIKREQDAHKQDKIEELVKEQEVHRTGDQEGSFSIHILGSGKTGASVIEQLLQSPPKGFLEDSRTRFTALVVDVGDQDLEPVRKAATAAGLPEERSQIRDREHLRSYIKISSGSRALTRRFGTSTTWLMRRSTATLHRA